MEPAPKLTPILKRSARETYGGEKGGRRRVSFEPLELTGDRMRSDWPIMRKTPCNLPPRRSKAKDRGKKRRHSASPLVDRNQNSQQLGQNLRQVLSRENLAALYQPNHRYSPRTTKMMLAQCSSKSPSPQIRKRKTIARTPPQHIPIMTQEDRILDHVPKRHKTMITPVLSQLTEQQSMKTDKEVAEDDYENRFDLNDCILWNTESASDVSMSDTSFSDASDQAPAYVPSSSPTSEISRTSDAAHLETIEEEADIHENTSPNVSPVRQHKRPDISPLRSHNSSPSCSISPIRRSRDHTIPPAEENLDLDASVASNLLSSFDQVSGNLPASQSGTEEQSDDDQRGDPSEQDAMDTNASVIEDSGAVDETETKAEEGNKAGMMESFHDHHTAGASQGSTKAIESLPKAAVDDLDPETTVDEEMSTAEADVDGGVPLQEAAADEAVPVRNAAVDEDVPLPSAAVDEDVIAQKADVENQLEKVGTEVEEGPTVLEEDCDKQITISKPTAAISPAITESILTTQESPMNEASPPSKVSSFHGQKKELQREEEASAMDVDSETALVEPREALRDVNMITDAALDVPTFATTVNSTLDRVQPQVNPSKEGEEAPSATVSAEERIEQDEENDDRDEQGECEDLSDDMSSESDTVYDIVISEGEGSSAHDLINLEAGTLVPFYIEEGEGEWFWLIQLQKDTWLDPNDSRTVLDGLTYCEASGWNAYRLCSDETRSIALNSCIFDSDGQLITLTFKENSLKRGQPSISSLHRALIEQAAVPQMESSFRSE